MSALSSLSLALALLALLCAPSPSGAEGGQEKLQALRGLMGKSKDGTATVSSDQLAGFLQGSKRPYSLIVGVMPHDEDLKGEAVNLQMTLRTAYHNFGLGAQAYKRSLGGQPQTVFFLRWHVARSMTKERLTFDLVNALRSQATPHVAFVPWEADVGSLDTYQVAHDGFFTNLSKKEAFFKWLREALDLDPDAMKPSDRSEGIPVGKIVALYAILLLLGRFVWLVWQRQLMKPLMALGAVALFWFATSGILKCLMAGYPLFAMHRTEQGAVPTLFYKEPRMQSIMEGVTMASCHCLVGLCLVGVTQVLPYTRSRVLKDIGSYVLAAVGVTLYMFIMSTKETKSGMTTRIIGIERLLGAAP